MTKSIFIMNLRLQASSAFIKNLHALQFFANFLLDFIFPNQCCGSEVYVCP